MQLSIGQSGLGVSSTVIYSVIYFKDMSNCKFRLTCMHKYTTNFILFVTDAHTHVSCKQTHTHIGLINNILKIKIITK